MAAGYTLLDVGGGARLERFGSRVVDRPHPAALGARGDPAAWRAADLRFDRERGWTGTADVTAAWPVEIGRLTLELKATEAGQVGLFPEHVGMLPWLADRVAERTADRVAEVATDRVAERATEQVPKRAAGTSDRPSDEPEVLHLFAYTGLVTLALAAAGAAVVHVDASRPTVVWARRNADRSGLAAKRLRWIVDDARAFTAREVRRGRRYAGVVLDPPTYGHGPGSGPWRIDENLPELLASLADLLEPEGFVLLTAHSPRFDPDRLASEIGRAFGRSARGLEAGDLELVTPDGRALALGAFARSSGAA